ncbi:MAG: hypothetical protein ACOX2F_00470 [bacterium]
MKKNFSHIVVILLFALCPANIYGETLRLQINYTKGAEKTESQPANVVDGYWRYPVINVPKVMEQEKYSFVIEGYKTIKSLKEVLTLNGVGVGRSNILFSTDGVLVIENKENFSRNFEIVRDGEDPQKKELSVPAKGSVSHVFSEAGDYTLVDTLFKWNSVQIKVLPQTYLFVMDEGVNRIEISDIPPGTYTVRVFYGTRWIYQEDFVMISSAAQNFGYKIEGGKVFSVNSTAYSTTLILED